MYEKRFLTIKVQCPGSPVPKVEAMQITLIKDSSGWFPLPCNGCDSMNGTMPCSFCCEAIRKLFCQDPGRDVSGVIHL